MEEYQLKENSQVYKKKRFYENIVNIKQNNTPFTRYELLILNENPVVSRCPQNSESYYNKQNYRWKILDFD